MIHNTTIETDEFTAEIDILFDLGPSDFFGKAEPEVYGSEIIYFKKFDEDGNVISTTPTKEEIEKIELLCGEVSE